MRRASFVVDVMPADAAAFAQLSGDWNPLHTDPDHAARTAYRRPVLHERPSPSIRLAYADRTPTGQLPTIEEAAEQVAWLLNNRGALVSGATLTLTGGAMP